MHLADPLLTNPLQTTIAEYETINHSYDCFHGRCALSRLLRIETGDGFDDNNHAGNCGDPAGNADNYDAPDNQGLLI